ncbi:GDP-perosamine synthase [Saliniradius amylolyticus]|uniref:GDP-perosamine synthase n=1 Tax=Saliniradius amylolyticus TaxID=2183582 RepID=A0A2S2E1V6_9ALTE|nr:LegC family aminotransferase [Saliniradius amylolyticus]AWL11631.1 GDP-perosamine synthase [Saliniradius amylolyticus]
MDPIQQLVDFTRHYYQTNDFIPLHAPQFGDAEKQAVMDTLESTFVSSVGRYVDEFEQQISQFTGSAGAVATVNGTAALHAALYASGVRQGDMVITQALSFVATANVIHHMGATPAFVDISPSGFGLCPDALAAFLDEHGQLRDGACYHKTSHQRIGAVVPMHTFGHPADMDGLLRVCQQWHIPLVEDAAESLGSWYQGHHTGTLGDFGALSFNGNKIITTGGGGMVLTRTAGAQQQVKHLTTTAKVPHPYEFFHDQAGFNYRMPNLNAALGCGQMTRLNDYLKAKRALAEHYQQLFAGTEYQFIQEPENCRSNYWLNGIICPDKACRDKLLTITNDQGVMTRPVWQLMHRLPMYQDCIRGTLPTAERAAERIVNLPSSPLTTKEA